MKLLVVSDIHGSLPAARFLVGLARQLQPQFIILLGDILYHGPRNPLPEGYDPWGVAEVLTPLAQRVIAVQGNCDSEVDKTMLPFALASPFCWIATDSYRIFATHGHAITPENLPPLVEDDIFLYGHTHVPTAQQTRGIYVCNPGSLALPKYEHPPSYGLFDGNTYSVITTEGDIYLQLNCL